MRFRIHEMQLQFNLAEAWTKILNSGMRRRSWIAFLGVCGIALLVATGWHRREPEYQARPLSVWLRGFESEVPSARWQSAEAVRHIGTNALPWLIARLEHKPITQASRWGETLCAWLSDHSVINITLPRPADERFEALAALDALGPNAKDAIPAVEKLLNETPPDPRAPLVLARFGPDAVAVLTRALTNDEKIVRSGSRVCLDMLRNQSEILFPRTAQDAEFARRTCEFNLRLVRAAFEDYKAMNPAQFSSDGMRRPSLPPGYNPMKMPGTNEPKTTLPRASPIVE